jgi:hypothetical protein
VGGLAAGRAGPRIGDAGVDEPELDRTRVVQHHLARAGQHGQPGIRRAEHAQQQVGERGAGLVDGDRMLHPGHRGPAGEQDTTSEPGQQRHRGRQDRRQQTHGRIVGPHHDTTGSS